MSFFENTRKPVGFSGKIMVAMMNFGHSAMTAWGLHFLQQASVAELPFEAEQFDVVTAFETVYFWPELAQNFREVYRVLKPGGTFFICNEANGETAKDDKWTDNMEFAFAHKNELCSPFKKRAHDPNALYDAYDESDDNEEKAKSGYLKGVGR